MSSVDLAGHMRDLERQRNLEHKLSPLLILFKGMVVGGAEIFPVSEMKIVAVALGIVREQTGRSFVKQSLPGGKEVTITRVL